MVGLGVPGKQDWKPLESIISFEMFFFDQKIPSLKPTWPMKIPMFPCKCHQKGGFSMAMLVLGRVDQTKAKKNVRAFFDH